MGLFERIVEGQQPDGGQKPLTEGEVSQLRIHGPSDLRYGLEDLQTGLNRWLEDREMGMVGRGGKGHTDVDVQLQKAKDALAAAVTAARDLAKTWRDNYY
jgi:hypothetical protein